MEEKIKVSVIVPMYNVEKYIAECIESVCRQKLEEIEIICINDGSSDGTAEIINRLQLKDKRIIRIDQKNKGVSASRNVGLKVAKGEYILFLDSDDYLKEEALGILYKTAKEQRLDELFFSATSFFDTEDLMHKQNLYSNYYERTGSYLKVLTGKEMFIAMHQNNEFKPSVCLQLWRRELIEEHKLRFYEGIIHEDNLFTIEAMSVSNRTMFLNEHLYMRRVRNNSIMTKEKAFQNAYGYFKVICELIEFAQKKHLSTDSVYWETYLKRLRILSDMSVKCIIDSKEEAKLYLENMIEQEQLLFNLIILNGVEVRKRLKSESQNKLQKEKDKTDREMYEKAELISQLRAIEQSRTYKIGKWLTWIPRKVKEVLVKGK